MAKTVAPTAHRGLIVVGPTPPPAHGVSVATLTLLSALRSLGLLRAHLDTRDPRSLANVGRFDFVNVWLALKQAVSLMRMLRVTPHTDVYIPISQGRWGIYRDALFAAIARLGGRRIYIHLHGGALHRVRAGARWPLRTAIDSTVGNAEQVWVLTSGLRSVIDGMATPDRVRVIENVVPDESLNGANGREPPPELSEHTNRRTRADRGCRILFLSQLSYTKGCFTLLDAMTLLGEQAASWHVRLVGDAESESIRRQLLRRTEDLRSGPTIEVLGPADEYRKWEHYAWADLFVLPTFYPYEGQPLVLLEALAAGVPVVSTFHAGIPETVRDEKEGLLVPANDPAALAAAMKRLTADDQLRDALSRAARKRFEERYTVTRLERDLANLLVGTAAAEPGVSRG